VPFLSGLTAARGTQLGAQEPRLRRQEKIAIALIYQPGGRVAGVPATAVLADVELLVPVVLPVLMDEPVCPGSTMMLGVVYEALLRVVVTTTRRA